MADAGINAVDKAIFARLNHSSVTGLVPAVRHMIGIVRPGSGGVVRPVDEYPVITVAFMTSDDSRLASFDGDAETLDYIIRAWDADSETLEFVGDVADAIDARLHKATLTPTGYTGGVFGIRRLRWVRGIEEPDKLLPAYPFAGAVYRFFTQRS